MAIAIIDFCIVAVLLAGDLVSKHVAASYLPAHGGSYVAIKDVLTFRFSKNTGAAFGIFENSRVFLSVFVGVVLLALIAFLVYHIVKKKYKDKGGVFFHVAMSLILAGGIGNLVDRIALGYVRDFIEYTIVYTLFKKDFAICNLADVYLTIGVIMVIIWLIYSAVLESRKEKKAKEVAAAPVDDVENVEEGADSLPEPTDKTDEGDQDD